MLMVNVNTCLPHSILISSLYIPTLHHQLKSTHLHPNPNSSKSFQKTQNTMTTKPSEKSPPEKTTLPIKKIPGDCGHSFFGPMSDRLDYFYNQGKENFFKSRIQKYNSTVFRVNMPPGPFIASDPKVVALLDGKSFPTLFDGSKVEKRDILTGTYKPSLKLTGGYRVLSYLDPSEPNHEKLKRVVFELVMSTRHRVIPEFGACYSVMFDELENELAAKGKAKFVDANDQAAFNFLGRAWYGADPTESDLGRAGPSIVARWVLCLLSPIMTLGLPKFLEELSLRVFTLPAFIVMKEYKKLYKFVYQNSAELFEFASELEISRDEACHNLVFATCFNTFSGIRVFFPHMVKHIARAGPKLHRRLAEEVRSVIRSNSGIITMGALEQMVVTKSTVYEALRLEPSAPYQFGRAKRDLIIESHNATFKVKEGELLFGYQPFATKDPKIFDRAEEFDPDRFVGDEGVKLLKHVLWSNGSETESPTCHNKQCAGKDFVVLISRLFVVEFFLRYDSFQIDVKSHPLGPKVAITSLKKATF